MRAEQLTRKTHLRKHTTLPTGLADRRSFDLTSFETGAAPEEAGDYDFGAPPHLHALSDFRRPGDAPAPTDAPGPCATFAALLGWAADLLAHSPAAGRLLDEAANNGWSIGLADLGSGGFFLDTHGRYVLLDHFSMRPDMLGRSIYFRNALLSTFIRALRDIWHERRFDNPLAGGVAPLARPDTILMLERIRAADCDTVTIQAGWELRGAGCSDVWRHLLGAEEGDMALIFSRYLERDPGALFDGSALACTFRQWYADAMRVDACDHQTLERLDALLAGENRPVVPALCMEKPPAEELTPVQVEARSLLPDGVRYLAGLGRTVLADPVFAGLGDPVNRTHMAQIVYDMEVTMVGNVPFRDNDLAKKIFPAEDGDKL